MAGKPQTLSEGQKKEVVDILRNKLIVWVSLFFMLLAGITGLSLWDIMKRAEAKVEELVAKQFEEPRIQEVVRKVASDRASVLMTEQITPEVIKFKDDIDLASGEIEKRVNQIEEVVSEAKIALDEVRSISDFSLLLTKASNDDRASFEKLQEIAETENHIFNKIATQALLKIITDPQVTGLFAYRIEWKEYNLDPAKASIEDFVNVLSQTPSIYHPFIINTIWDQERFPKYERLTVLYQAITEAPNIQTLVKACKLMNEEAKLDLNVLGHKQYAKWWEENREKYNCAGGTPAFPVENE